MYFFGAETRFAGLFFVASCLSTPIEKKKNTGETSRRSKNTAHCLFFKLLGMFSLKSFLSIKEATVDSFVFVLVNI